MPSSHGGSPGFKSPTAHHLNENQGVTLFSGPPFFVQNRGKFGCNIGAKCLPRAVVRTISSNVGLWDLIKRQEGTEKILDAGGVEPPPYDTTY